MTLTDVGAGLRFCRASGWNQTAEDWGQFLTAAPNGAVVAVEHGEVIGTTTTMPYGPFTWISMVLVDPSARGRGVGTRLLQEGLSRVTDNAVARLDATPPGEQIYRDLGFVSEGSLTRLRLVARPRRVAHASVARQLRTDDWPALLEQDRLAFGASRANLLRWLAAAAPEYAWITESAGRLRGYLLGRHGHICEQLGPLVADSCEVAGILVDACLAAHPDRDFFIDVPDAHQSWNAILRQTGFRAERPFLRMCRGARLTADPFTRVYAITGPEFG